MQNENWYCEAMIEDAFVDLLKQIPDEQAFGLLRSVSPFTLLWSAAISHYGEAALLKAGLLD